MIFCGKNKFKIIKKGRCKVIASSGALKIIVTNVFFILVWDLVVFCACKMLNEKYFDYNKYIYKIKYWEENGFLYSKKLKIKAWKDELPQYISKNGFSKKNFSSLSLEYVNRFILETCRAEWAHRKCLWIGAALMIVNRFFTGVIFTFFVLLINLPYICIQRYNRIRLMKVRDKILKRSTGNIEIKMVTNLANTLKAVDS